MKPKLLLVTDLHYQAKGRKYYEEDMYLSSQLGESFDLVICHPNAANAYLGDVDIVLFRNTGPVLYFSEVYDAFKAKAIKLGTKVFTELTGKADMVGKQYLIDLTNDGYPVIPSVDAHEDLSTLPVADRYIEKLKLGADSIGMSFVSAEDLHTLKFSDNLVQPVIEFAYEVSFYFINHDFQYALYAPNANERWKLETYEPTGADLLFAQKFVEWNSINYGIQRIDACRTPNGDLLLMEVEDLNPYLSLDLLAEDDRDRFVKRLSEALIEYAEK